MKIQHVQLSVPAGQTEAARTFYVETLGFPEISRAKGLTNRPGLWLSLAGDQELHLAEDAEATPATSKAHVAFLVDRSDGIEARLTTANVPIEKRTETATGTRVHFRDPFGNRIELIITNVPMRTEEDFSVDFPKGDLERVLKNIESKVQEFLEGDQKKLLNWLYRLDVAEKNIKAIWDNVAKNRWSRRISELIFQRELQKYFSRRESKS